MYKRKAEPDGFCIYRGAMKTLRLLPDEKAGRVIKAAVSLFLEGIEPEEMDLAEQMAFAVIEEDIKKALEKHAAICDRNRKNRNADGDDSSPVVTSGDEWAPELNRPEQNLSEQNGSESSKPHSLQKKYGEYGRVLLTEDQHQKLLQELGQPELDRCIQYIDEAAQSSGNKNKWKDWNLVIRRCHREGWGMKPKAADTWPGKANIPKAY